MTPLPARRVRVVVADDHAEILQRTAELLDVHFDVSIAASGEEALEAIHALAPELVLLDVRMPGMSGLDVAARLSSAPQPPGMALMSTAMADDVIHAGLSVGVRAFVSKYRLHQDLVPALMHLQHGRGFLPRAATFARMARQSSSRHALQLHSSRDELMTAITAVFRSAWRQGDALLAVAPAESLRALEERLRGEGIDPDVATAERRYLAVDASTALEMVLRDGRLDSESFTALFGTIVDDLSRGGGHSRHVCAFGEITPVLEDRGQFAEAVHIERVANEFMLNRPLSIVCGCRSSHAAAADQHSREMCDEHSVVLAAIPS